MKKIELLAPAKSYDSAIAAIDYGADAIYIGGARFGARHAASNSVEDIARVVEYAHRYGVGVHCTLNTLIFENELEEAERTAREIVATGIDALIVQDMAFARMGLDVDLHASTQMCNMTAEGVKFLSDCGFSRVVLERALSLDTIREIGSACPDVELEAFVHGAICVGHSGRCYLSRTLSERSGNRGECSQPCRLTYDLVDAEHRKILEAKHLLSVRDLNLSSQIGNMLDAGVTSFKIEGRLKEIGYTKNIVAHYRQSLDRAIAERPTLERSSSGKSLYDFKPNPSKSFTRGESEYLLYGQRARVASFDTPKSVGESLGRVDQRRGQRFKLRTASALHAGDGICFVTTKGLVGTNINSVDGEWITPNRIDSIERGVEIFRNFDKAFSDTLERSRTHRVVEVTPHFVYDGSSIELTYTDTDNYVGSASQQIEFEAPKNLDKMLATLREQITKCGATIFRACEPTIEGEIPFIASSKLAELRRQALEELLAKRMAGHKSRPRFSENRDARLPYRNLTGHNNVTNSAARRFFEEHGAESIEQGLDLSLSFEGERVMESSYCIRREINECLRQGSKLRSELYIERGGARYRLEFDCKICRMYLIKTTKYE